MQERTREGIGLDKHPLSETHEEDFAELFEASGRGREPHIQRDDRVEGRVVSVGEEWVFVDIGAKSEGVISAEELRDEHGNLSVRVGDSLTAYVVNIREGEIRLSVKMTAAASEDALRSAHRAGVPVEGLVIGERKGGFTVKVFGKEAFCPYSQIDLHHATSPEEYLHKRFTFRVTEYSDRGRNIVLSRREILEEERLKHITKLKESLSPGDVVTGMVQNLTNFGAFVDLGGIHGLIPMSELAWYRVDKSSDILTPGQTVTVRILELDWAHNRISLSLKQTTEDPWISVLDRYKEQTIVTGTVTKLMNYGAFVQLEPGVEGLIHISNLGTGRRISHPREVLSEGESVEVKVLSVDRDARRIGLELLVSKPEAEAEPQIELVPGIVVTGVVESVRDYGVFVGFPGGKTGLLHVSQIDDAAPGDFRKRFPLGSIIEVQVLTVNPDTGRIALSTKTLKDREEEAHVRDYAAVREVRPSLGTLGDLLKQREREKS